jgi:CRISPR-associated protein Cas2
MSELLMVFSYDISGDRERRRVAKLLEKRLVRVQMSVFEGRMTRQAAHRLARRASRFLQTGDSLRVYAITMRGRDASLAFGPLPIAERQDFWLV